MIRHTLKMIWNRKRSNGLLLLEITLSMLVLFAAVAIAVNAASRYRAPMGFEYHGLYDVSLDMKRLSQEDWLPAQSAKIALLLQELRRVPEIQEAVGSYPPLFTNSGMTSAVKKDGKWVPFRMSRETDDAIAALKLHIIQGRGFSPEDDASQLQPVMINRKLRDLVFGGANPIGKATSEDRKEVIVGVFEEFRMRGELTDPPEGVMLRRTRFASDAMMQIPAEASAEDSGWIKNMYFPPENLLLRVRPGTNSAVEKKIIQTCQRVAPEWSFRVKSAEDERHAQLLLDSAPLLAAGLVAAFLLIMVVLGLMGVLWQNVTRRREELGLRRAVGGTQANVLTQILAEVLALTATGVFLASLLLIQIPLLNLLAGLPWNVFIVSWIISLGLMLALTAASGLYPAWLAARIQPADALRYD